MDFGNCAAQTDSKTPRQGGGCFVAGSMVLMANGSEQAIENVQTGDSVRCPSGECRRVLRTYTRNYEGMLVAISTALNMRSVTATPEHSFRWYQHNNAGSQFVDGQETPEWKPIGAMIAGNRLLICSPRSLAVPVLRVWHKPGFVGHVHTLNIEAERAFVCNGYAVAGY